LGFVAHGVSSFISFFKQAHKLKDTVLEFIERQRQEADELLRPDALAKMVRGEFGLSIHPRSIERALSKSQKKGR